MYCSRALKKNPKANDKEGITINNVQMDVISPNETNTKIVQNTRRTAWDKLKITRKVLFRFVVGFTDFSAFIFVLDMKKNQQIETSDEESHTAGLVRWCVAPT